MAKWVNDIDVNDTRKSTKNGQTKDAQAPRLNFFFILNSTEHEISVAHKN